MPLLHERGPRGHHVLHLDDRRHRDDVPLPLRVVTHEVAAHRVRVGPGHGHLPHVVQPGQAHGQHQAGVAVVEVEVIVGGAEAAADLQTEADVKRLLAGPAYPEVGFAGFTHLDAPLFHDPGPHHQAVQFQATVEGQGVVTTGKLGRERGRPRSVIRGRPAAVRAVPHALPPGLDRRAGRSAVRRQGEIVVQEIETG